MREEEEDVANEGTRIAEAESNGTKFMLKTEKLTKVSVHPHSKAILAILHPLLM